MSYLGKVVVGPHYKMLSSYENLQQAVLALGLIEKYTLYIDKDFIVYSDFSIPENISVISELNNIITIETGAVLTINGPFASINTKIFECLGTGKVVFGPNSVSEIVPQWWGSDDITIVNVSEAKVALSQTMKGDVTIVGNMQVPVGTTAERPVVPRQGQLRFNSDTNKFEGFDGSVWDDIAGGAGAVGGGTDKIFIETEQVVTTSYTITAGKNAITVGPLTYNEGVTVTVPDGARLVIL